MELTKVMVIGTLHNLHEENKQYSYDDLFQLIEGYQPDVIGVEVREEDLYEGSEYLSQYYPYEMIEIINRYQEEKPLYGFDWLGESIEETLIPDDYFDSLKVKQLEQEFEADEHLKKEHQLIECIDEVRFSCIVRQSAKKCNNGRYDAATEILHKQLETLLNGTKYEEMIRFYQERDWQIADRILTIIKDNPGKRIVFVTGLDHRYSIIQSIEQQLGDRVMINQVK